MNFYMKAGSSPSSETASTQPQPLERVAPAEELKRVDQLQQKESSEGGVKAGQTYYLISQRWYTEWKEWAGAQNDVAMEPDQEMDVDNTKSMSPQAEGRPGPIDNSALLESEETSVLKKSVLEHQDFQIISKAVWTLLHGWYTGGPTIARRAISVGAGESVQVELYGLELKIYRSSDLSNPLAVTESKTATVGELKRRMCEEFQIEEAKCRIWDYFNQRKYALLEKDGGDEKTLSSCRIFDGNGILLEEANADGSWPKEDDGNDDLYGPSSYIGGGSISSSYSPPRSSFNGSQDIPTRGTPPIKGAVGLQNLGNTCFMNSALQCLSNVPKLREYFVTDEYRSGLNTGAWKTNGKLAESFAQLMTLMWQEDVKEVAPRNFKWQVGQFAEQFVGYGQQDSMELIEYVLDGLKEDVNRIHGSKPHVELQEADGRPDSTVAQEARQLYARRNDSHIDDLFLGFYKSTLRCPEAGCNRVSVTMDPYLSLKLPLVSTAQEKQLRLFVWVVPCDVKANDENLMVKHSISVRKSGTIKDVIEAAASEAGIEAEKCLLVEIWNKKIQKFLEASENLENLKPEDVLVLYEVLDRAPWSKVATEQRWSYSSYSWNAVNTDSESANPEELQGVIIHHRQAKSSTSSSSFYTSKDLIGLPMLLCIPKSIQAQELVKAVEDRLHQLFGFMEVDGADRPWELYRVSDKWNLNSGGTKVETGDSTILTIGSREYLAVEWTKGVELPAGLTKIQQNLDKGSTSDRNSGSAELPLERCFEMFVEQEQLGQDDSWYCNKCKKHVEAFKKLDIWAVPPVLTVQLKRFTYTRYSRDRLDTAVHFPLEGLDIGRCCVSNSEASTAGCVFDLCAVSKHIGSLGGGHYVAYVRSCEDGEWYYCDDSRVRRVDATEVRNDHVGAYVLFYIRRDYRPSKWPAPVEST